MQDWAEIRRLSLAEGLSGRQIAERLRVSRNTVKRALESDKPPKYERAARGSQVDAYEPQIRELLQAYPRMKATVIAERINYPYSSSSLRARVAELRPLYVGVDPADRLEYAAGEVVQCDLWFPDIGIQVGYGQFAKLPVLVMVSAYSRMISAVMLPSRQTGDLLSGMWHILNGWGRSPKELLWDNEAGIGQFKKLTPEVIGFAGTLGLRVRQTRPRDPETKGIVERANQYLETSFLPGRTFKNPTDFNTQVADWLARVANRRLVRRVRGRPVELFEIDRAAMNPLPTITPGVGLRSRVRLARDYYVRVGRVDYSVHPSVIGRNVDITASLDDVLIRHEQRIVAQHARVWAKHVTVTDPVHRAAALEARNHYQTITNTNPSQPVEDVQIRDLADYDTLYAPDLKEAS